MTLFAPLSVHSVPTFTARIYIAGDYNSARDFARQWVSERGACWCLAPADYIYTGGEERGLVATLIHYPRFPRSNPPEHITKEARDFGEALMHRLGQASFSLETPLETFWLTRRA